MSISTDNWAGFYDEQVGSIYSVTMDGSDIKEILDGEYNNLAISPDGKNLAVQSYVGEYDEFKPESLIVIVHVETGIAESVWISLADRIKKIVWGNDGSHLYYLTPNAIRRIRLADLTDEFVMTVSGVVGFDLFVSDSIYLDTVMWYPEIDPIGQQYVVGTNDIFASKLLMYDMQQDTLFILPDSLAPYYDGWVGQPYWLPDGNTLVFSAAERRGGSPGHDAAQIWILKNVFEQIEE